MADMVEIQEAVRILEQQGSKRSQISLLHCCTDYPASPEQVNLRAIQTMKEFFPDMVIGYSDHTAGVEIALAAVAMGAGIIEKHFTLSCKVKTPDSAAVTKNTLK